MELIKIFTHNIKKWRKIAGISQEKLAERCNSAHSYIRQIECGSRYPSFSLVEKIAKALNIAPYQLFYDEEAVKTGASTLSEMQYIETELLGTITDDIHKAFEKYKA